MPSRLEVVAAARSWIGAPIQHQGRTRDGVDCVGLVIGIARALGLADGWLEQPYRRFPDEASVRSVLDAHLDRRTGPPLAGDVVLCRWRRTANHLGVVVDGHQPYGLIHAYFVVGRVVEHRADESWRDRIADVYCYRGVG